MPLQESLYPVKPVSAFTIPLCKSQSHPCPPFSNSYFEHVSFFLLLPPPFLSLPNGNIRWRPFLLIIVISLSCILNSLILTTCIDFQCVPTVLTKNATENNLHSSFTWKSCTFLNYANKSEGKNSLGFKNANSRTLSTSFPLGNDFSLALVYRGHQLEIAQDAQDTSLNYS